MLFVRTLFLWAVAGAVAVSAGACAGGSTKDVDSGTSPVADALATDELHPSELDASDEASDEAGDDAGSRYCPPLVLSCPETVPSYANDIAPIFDQRCNTCHNPLAPDGPWPFDSYANVRDWRREIFFDLRDCLMPPDDSGAVFSEEERQLIGAWLACNSPLN